MYPNVPDWLGSTLHFAFIVFTILGIWKLIDIAIWLYSNVTVRWG